MTSPGPVLRDAGHQQVLEHSSAWWVSCARTAIETLAASGRPFTIEDVRALGVPEPHHSNAWGGVTRGAMNAGLIRHAGYVPAGRSSARARALSQWVGTAVEAA